MALSDDVKAETSLVEVAGPRVEWDLRKSIPARGDWWAPCPFHAEVTASFHVTEPGGTGGQFYCFGCNAKGSVIDFVMEAEGVTFGDAVKRLAREGGVASRPDPAAQEAAEAKRAARIADQEAADDARADKTRARASAIWREARGGDPRLAEYLLSRGVDVSAIGGVPATLRYHPDLPCYAPAPDRDCPVMIHRGPAMVAFVGRSRLEGIHRTWITPTGRARLPDGSKVPKKMLGRCFGHPTVLTRPGCVTVMVGEGIETTLAGLTLAARRGVDPATITAEAALTLGALAGPQDYRGRPNRRTAAGNPLPSPRPDLAAPRPGWCPPAGTGRAVILADPSAKDPEAAQAHAERARAKIIHAMRALTMPGRVQLAVPLDRWDHDRDFADLAKDGA
ncbi:DNA primase [Dinoroseobacter phage vB_DshS-R4C]|nr:DNA primase [Dinoroseobacter phage vB_DshS-R4C]